MRWKRIAVAALITSTIALGACTGGDMGNTRGGGAAPGQSGARDTTGAGVPSATSSTAAKDSSKRGATTGAKRP